MKFCSITGCPESLTDAQADTTEKLFGRMVCVKHEKDAVAEAEKAAEKFIIDTSPYLKCGFQIQNGLAIKMIGQAEITVDIGKVHEKKPKRECIQIGGYDYELGLNAEVDRELKTLFGLIEHKGGAGEQKKEKPAPKAAAPEKPTAPDAHENALARIRDVELTPESIIKYLCPDATFEEAVLFLQVCKHRNLNPFIPGEVFLIKYDKTQPASTVVGKYAFTKKADQHKDFRGYSAGIIVLNKEGKIEEREGTFYLPRGKDGQKDDVFEVLLGGWARVKRKDREDFIEKVSLQECIRYKKDGQLMRGWREQPATLIRKNALVRALREAFPAELSGLYDQSEIMEVEK